MKSDKLAYAREIQDSEDVQDNILMMGIASRPTFFNPFRKKGRLSPILRDGVIYMFIESGEESEKTLKQIVDDLNNRFKDLPYTNKTRQQYRKLWNTDGILGNMSMLTHFWINRYGNLKPHFIPMENFDTQLVILRPERMWINVQTKVNQIVKQLNNSEAYSRIFKYRQQNKESA